MICRAVRSAAAASAVLSALLLGGCGGAPAQRDGPPEGDFDPSSVPDAVPREEPRSRYGNPPSYQVFGRTYRTLDTHVGYRERGIASWYGRQFHGRLTSNREPYDMYAMTAAHRSLPLPSYVRVTHLGNGRSVVVRVNDRGPFHGNRIIDLSYAAAAKLDMHRQGTAPVEVVALNPGAPKAEPLRPPLAEPRLYLQVGAFGNRFNAQRLSQRLDRALDQPVLIQPHQNGGRTLYRVRIGPLSSVHQSDQVMEALLKMGLEDIHTAIE